MLLCVNELQKNENLISWPNDFAQALQYLKFQNFFGKYTCLLWFWY